MRWHHPGRGLIYPDEFLAGRAVRDDAPAHRTSPSRSRWPRQPSGGAAGIELPVAVNVSVRDLSDRGFADVVAGLLRDHELPAGALKLEITERVLMADPTRMSHALEAMGRLGVDLSLDDFGTGYSSLVHLKRLPGLRDQGRPLVRAADDHRRRRRARSSAPSSTWPTRSACASSPRASRRPRPGGRCEALGCDLRAGLPDQPPGAGRRGHPLAARTSAAGHRPEPATTAQPAPPMPLCWRPDPPLGWSGRPARDGPRPRGASPRMTSSGSITRDEVAHLARLARLALDDDELDRFGGQLDAIVVARSRGSASSPPPTCRRPRTRCR